MRCTETFLKKRHYHAQVGLVAPTNTGGKMKEGMESSQEKLGSDYAHAEKAPKTIIYDFACSLHTYCLNRDPIFFEHTRFLVDRFHRSCSRGYNMDMYPALKEYNSQVNEQANPGLKRIQGQVSYMTERNFMTHCKLYLFNKNNNVIANS